ncbi:hypothetical protein [Clostridium sp. ZS2-4]|uniref:hypothetical protein n=1 Tax=Clostridium sp. ZS2-4 TaxID=2987703 RepID=UPI00227BF5B0|nr:hypothetical protein [Clostridium sp. ZS2-4]MCY6355820.1 hypothetical protein [Clostridium sp. ZS2-4]
MDTLGGMVREIKYNGALPIVFVGGFMGNSDEKVFTKSRQLLIRMKELTWTP